jgi:hypothetical protein
VIARIAAVVRATGEIAGRPVAVGHRRRHRPAERHQRGADERCVLAGATASDEGAAGAVVMNRQVAAEVGAALLTATLFLLTPLGRVWVDDLHQSSSDLSQVGCVELLRLAEQRLDSALAHVVGGGSRSIARAITCALAVESQPSRCACATGASTGCSIACANRTIAGPAPLCSPATAVTKSRVEAHPSLSTPRLASRSRTTSSSIESSTDRSSSIATTVSIFSPLSRAAHSTSPSFSSTRCASSSTRAAPVCGGRAVLVMTQPKHRPPTTDSFRKSDPTKCARVHVARTSNQPPDRVVSRSCFTCLA